MAKPSNRNAAPIVLADVGGTNVRFAVLTGGVLGPVLYLAVRDHAQFSDALAVFLDRQSDRATIRSAIFAVAGVVVGFDFHFGKGRVGSPSLLVSEAPRLGIEVDVQAHVDIAERPVSSSAIRMALAEGQIEEATAMLGGPWFVTGQVIHGEKRGRDLGYPTANIRLDRNCGLRHGIYAVRVGLDGQRFEAVASFGRRPTFDNGAPLLEVFLFDFDGDLYGQTIDVALIGWLRHEQKFESVETLKRYIMADVAQARDALKRAGKAAFPKLGDVE